MFVLSQSKTFTAPVIAHIPVDGGRTKKATFTVKFKALEKSEVDDLLAKARQSAKDNLESLEKGGTRTNSSDRNLIDEVLVGFGDDIKDEDGVTPLAFSQANVDRLCAIWPIEPAIVKSFIDNYINAPTKN